jgi:hypothetical protein
VADGFTYVNQDLQGKEHLHVFDLAILDGKDIVVDRMNFSEGQRRRYLDVAKSHSYDTAITVFHESLETCLNRCLWRTDHLTIKDESSARSALNTFFTKYERVQDSEADTVQRLWPDGLKPAAIVVDLDGTLCDVAHRRHFVNPPNPTDPLAPKPKKDWKGFFEAMSEDTPNGPVADILIRYITADDNDVRVVYCSGRPDNYRKTTWEWLNKHGLDFYSDLFMRPRNDQRQDDIVKEIILDFEILTRYTPYFMLDDRDQVVKMWRKRGYTCLQCAPGDF